MHIHLNFPRLFKGYLYVNGAHTTMRPCTISKKSSPLSRSFSERVGHSVLLLYSHRPFSAINGLGPNLHSVHTMCSVPRFLSLFCFLTYTHIRIYIQTSALFWPLTKSYLWAINICSSLRLFKASEKNLCNPIVYTRGRLEERTYGCIHLLRKMFWSLWYCCQVYSHAFKIHSYVIRIHLIKILLSCSVLKITLIDVPL